jgi:hypothetical protein
MSGDAFKKVQPGQRAHIPAAAYNAFIDAANAHRMQGLSQLGNGHSRPLNSDEIRVRNQTGVDLEAGSVVQIGWDPANFAPFTFSGKNILTCANKDFVLQANLPGSDADAFNLARKTYAITREPIPSNRVGLAIVDGVAFVPVDVTANIDWTEYRYANPVNDETAYLRASYLGYYEILHASTVTGWPQNRWMAMVRRADSLIGKVWPVMLSLVSGSAGSATQRCSFIYKAHEYVEANGNLGPVLFSDGTFGAQLGQAGTGGADFEIWSPRPQIGKMVRAYRGLVSVPFLESNPVLIWTDEAPEQVVCS